MNDITFDSEPSSSEVKFIFDSLEQSNSKFINIESTPFSIAVKKKDNIIAGIDCFTKWGLLMVDILWVAEEFRGQGIGQQLMKEAEKFAIAEGCLGVELYTMSFQSKEFYIKLGYTVVGEINKCHSEASKIFMFKEL